MSTPKTRILYMEDDVGLARLLERRLSRHGYDLTWVADGESGLERLRHETFDVAAIDYEMPGLNGLSVLEHIQKLKNPPPALMISGAGDMDTAIAAMKAGAADYVVKTVDGRYLELLPRTIERILEKERLQALADAAQRAYEKEQRVLAAVFQASAEPMLITDSAACVERCNPAFEALLGYSLNELLGCNPSSFASTEHDAEFFESLWDELESKGHWRGTIWNCHKDGTPLAQHVTLSAIDDGTGKIRHYVAVYTDVTEQIHRENAVRHQAHHDALTGLPNRSLLQDRIAHAIKSAKRDKKGFSLLFIDLDGFKPVNDDYGHRTGDLLLKEISCRLSNSCRDSDTVARYGGDEFVVLLRNTDDINAIGTVVEKLMKQIATPVKINDVNHKVRASVGIALYPKHAQDAEKLLKRADQAMYSAKSAGKECYRFFEEHAEQQ